MLKFFRSLISDQSVVESPVHEAVAAPPAQVEGEGVAAFDVIAHLQDANGLPVLDWEAVTRWIEKIANPHAQATAWSDCERAWLEHLRAALGDGYALVMADDVALLSPLATHVAQATVSYVAKTRQRILRVLDGVAQVAEWGMDILVVFEDEETYYRYVAHYYPEGGHFAGSGGMYIHHGCGHFVSVQAELHALEPVIAHELTHACLSHLPIPAWLNEGLAVNTEHRLSPPPSGAFSSRSSPQQMQARHRKFWGAAKLQEFWSGKSFLRPDEGNELSYDLARILVSQFAGDWGQFRSFALEANADDGGATAARNHLGVDLGQAVCVLLEVDPAADLEPDPSAWTDAPERGAFRNRGGSC